MICFSVVADKGSGLVVSLDLIVNKIIVLEIVPHKKLLKDRDFLNKVGIHKIS